MGTLGFGHGTIASVIIHHTYLLHRDVHTYTSSMHTYVYIKCIHIYIQTYIVHSNSRCVFLYFLYDPSAGTISHVDSAKARQGSLAPPAATNRTPKPAKGLAWGLP